MPIVSLTYVSKILKASWSPGLCICFSFVPRSSEPLATTCAGRHLTIMDHTVSNDESLLTFTYHNYSLSVSHMPGSVHGRDTAVRSSRPGSRLGSHSSKGRQRFISLSLHAELQWRHFQRICDPVMEARKEEWKAAGLNRAEEGHVGQELRENSEH